MSSSKFATPLRFELRPSRIAAGVLIFIHAGAIVSVAVCPLNVLLKLIAIIVVILSLRYSLDRVLLRNYVAIRQFIWASDDEWTLIAHDGQTKSATLLSSSYVQPWMTVLNFKTGQRFQTCSVVILPDAIDAEVFRRLRIRMTLIRYKLAGQV